MARKRLFQISVVILLLTTACAQGSSLSISIGERGVRFSASNRPAISHHRRPIHTYPRIVMPRPSLAVPSRRTHIHRPVYHPIAKPCVKPGVVTVWITNSNGSKLPVVLTKTSHGYKGHRGECYTTFPSHRQLCRAYGF